MFRFLSITIWGEICFVEGKKGLNASCLINKLEIFEIYSQGSPTVSRHALREGGRQRERERETDCGCEKYTRKDIKFRREKENKTKKMVTNPALQIHNNNL